MGGTNYKFPISSFESARHDGTINSFWIINMAKTVSTKHRNTSKYALRLHEIHFQPVLSGTEIPDQKYTDIEKKIQIVLWAFGPTKLYEMTKTEFGRKVDEMTLEQLITIYKKHFTFSRNIHQSRGDFLLFFFHLRTWLHLILPS